MVCVYLLSSMSVSVTSLIEEAVVEIIRNSQQDLTNPQIRTKLHQMKFTCNKREINQTLHELKNRNVLQFQSINNYNYWRLSACDNSISSSIVPLPLKIEEDDVLIQVKQNALHWKNRSPTNELPKRLDKIENFVDNCALKGLSREVLKQISQDIFKNGWD